MRFPWILVLVGLGTARAERLRVEAVPGTIVTVDGVARGHAPVELDVEPGTHHVTGTASSHEPASAEVYVWPGERSLVRLGMVPTRNLRVMPVVIGSFPLRTDTPFDAFAPGIAVQVLHDIAALKIGATVEYHARTLNSAGAGLVATWCARRFAGRWLAWCPVTGVATWVFGERDGRFDSGHVAARAATALEARRGWGFVRLGAGVGITDYRRVADRRVLVLWSSIVELAVGAEL